MSRCDFTQNHILTLAIFLIIVIILSTRYWVHLLCRRCYFVADKKRINIAIDPELHKQLKVMTVEKDTNITEYVVEAIKNQIDKDKEGE